MPEGINRHEKNELKLTPRCSTLAGNDGLGEIKYPYTCQGTDFSLSLVLIFCTRRLVQRTLDLETKIEG